MSVRVFSAQEARVLEFVGFSGVSVHVDMRVRSLVTCVIVCANVWILFTYLC